MKKFRSLMGASAVLALSVTHAAFASQVGNTYYSISDVTPPYPTGLPALVLTWVNPAGTAVGTFANATTGINNKVVWTNNTTTHTYSYIGLEPTDSAYYAGSNSTGVNAVTTSSPINAINSVGDVIGTTTRLTNGASAGSDAWVYLAGSTATSGTVLTTPAGNFNVLTPLVVNPTGTAVPDSNGVTTKFSFVVPTGAATGAISESGSANLVNASGQVLGTSTRYTKTGATASSFVGTDAWLTTTGSAPQTVLLGLGVNNSAVGYSYDAGGAANLGLQRSTSILSNGSPTNAPGIVSLNDNGIVIGTSTRYAFSSSSTSAGTDAWMYTGNGNATAASTYQIGLIGGIYETSPTSLSAGNVFTTSRSTTLKTLNSAGQVGGQTAVYGTGATTTSSIGTAAWIYTPAGTPTTTTALGTNGYVQVGLTASVAGPVSATNVGYTALNGGQTSSIVGLGSNGHAAGTSNRYVNTSATQAGTDLWYYDGISTKVITPNAQNGVIGNNPTLTTNTYVGSTLVATQVGNVLIGTVPSNYITPTGSISTSISAMSPNGNWIAGQVQRISSSGAPLGYDVFIYDAVHNTDTVLVAPYAGVNATLSESAYVLSITDSGLAAGSYTTTSASDGNSIIGVYLYEWSPSNGFVTINEYHTGNSTGTSTVQKLNNALADQSGWTDVIAPNFGALPIDNNFNIYGLGDTGAFTNNGSSVFEISVPEPGSLTLLALGGLALVRRNRRSVSR